jgi:NAD(P)-dependent dehydrogenase (short-subunit alcohol dehydrogenase family)
MKNAKKVAVISGGAGYLGSAVANEFIRNDFFAVAIDREHCRMANTENMEFKGVDISDAFAVQKIAEEIKAEFGEIFALVHVASAPLVRRPVLSLSEEDFKSQFLVNVFGGFHLFKYFLEMVKDNGAIIGVTSSSILSGIVHSQNGSYVSAKYGLQGLLHSLISEVSSRVYSVAPAFMPGGLNGDMPEIVREFVIKKGRKEDRTNPNDVARAILVLANDTEKKWNGKTIAMPGFLVNEL